MTRVTFADLTHTGLAIDANNNPLAVGYVAAYANQQLGGAIRSRLFKYPAALSEFLAHDTPTIACFTNYMWNERLSCTFAARIKARHPDTVVVMGGPNYPLDPSEQHQYLKNHPEIDFFIDGEGELAFVELFKALEAVDFQPRRLREPRTRVPNVHYVTEGELVRGDMLPRILDLDRVPSPYTTGLLDEFFDDRLTPMLQTSRGCPYSCTFCHDGIAYMNKTRTFSFERVEEELAYIEARVKTATLQLADLNWGMFPSDIRVAQQIADTRQRSGWPRNVMTATAKNQKDRIIEMSRILGDLLQPGASVQSTDPEVLRNVKRQNLSLDAIVKMAKGAAATGTGTFTEIILGLPGDTKEKHLKSVFDMLDAGIQDIRSFQFILLPGTEGNDVASRARYQYRTGFRVLARCFGRYDIYDASAGVAEIQEICLGNNTMPEADYFECRAFDLTVAMFNNGGVLKEFFRLAETLGVTRSVLIARLHELVKGTDGPLADLYAEFRVAEQRNFFPTRESLIEFLDRPETIDAYLRGEYGVNHIYKARTEALVLHYPRLARLAQEAVEAELRARSLLDPILQRYLDELWQVSVARRAELTDLDRASELTLHFDFPALHAADYAADPREFFIAGGAPFTISHTATQRTDLRRYFAQYGHTIEGFGQFLHRNDSHLSSFLYRTVDYAATYTGRRRPAPVVRTDTAPTRPEPGPARELPQKPPAQPLEWVRHPPGSSR
jgi:radical SAM superfamily enzyme YgiQ (UPF0313 family)